MAHKKKGGKKGNSTPAPQGNGTGKPASPQTTEEPKSFKEAVLKDLDVNGSGPAASENGSQANSPAPSPRQNGPSHNGKAEAAPAAKANGKQPTEEPAEDLESGTPAAAGSQAQLDAHKALEQTVEHLKGDLRAEQSRRQEAETYLYIYKAATASLGLTTLGFAALALLTLSRCKS